MTRDLQRAVEKERRNLKARAKKMTEFEQGGEEKDETGLEHHVAHDKAELQNKSKVLTANRKAK